MGKDRYTKIDQWLQRQEYSLRRKFGDDRDTAIYFADYDNYEEGKRITLIDGCDIVISDRMPAVSFMVRCYMRSGVTLPLHHHPDYSELFYIISGILVDLVTGISYGPGDLVTFNQMIRHHMSCTADAEISIKCTYTG
jgi:quercetin dioxygenase-like cupin family protein